MNFNPVIFSNFSFSNKKGKDIENYKNDIFYTAPIFDLNEFKTAPIKKFIASYDRKNNSLPDFNAAYGYDNLKIINDAINSNKEVNQFLRSNYVYLGVTGKIQILTSGDSVTEMKVVSRK